MEASPTYEERCHAYLYQTNTVLEPRSVFKCNYDVGSAPFCAKGKYANDISFEYTLVDPVDPHYADIYQRFDDQGRINDICDMRTMGRPDWPWYMRIPLNDVEANVEDDYVPMEGDYVPEEDDYVQVEDEDISIRRDQCAEDTKSEQFHRFMMGNPSYSDWYKQRIRKKHGRPYIDEYDDRADSVRNVRVKDFIVCGDYFSQDDEDSDYIPNEVLEEVDEEEVLRGELPWEVYEKEDTVVRPLDVAQVYKDCPYCQAVGEDYSPLETSTIECGHRRYVVDALIHDYLVKYEDRVMDNL